MKLSSFSPRNLKDTCGIQDLTQIPFYEASNLSDLLSNVIVWTLHDIWILGSPVSKVATIKKDNLTGGK